jgi:formate dehydrogenase major subunit
MAILGNDGVRGPRGFLRSHIGFVPNPMSKRSQGLAPRIRDAQVFDSVCPYCAVGCSQKVYVRDGKILDIEGNAESPINAGHLCPKGAATYQFTMNPNRPKKVLYRAPGGQEWQERSLDWAMERIAHLVKDARDHDLQEQNADGLRVNRLESIGHIGGATLDNEENYLILKLFRNLGMVHITNQARI